MRRVVLLIGAVAVGGCQAQNPYAAIGPPRVPAPTTSQSLPYYPPTGAAAAPQARGATAAAASPRMNVSVEGSAPASSPRTGYAADPADREPIRIVENPAAATRTASAPARSPQSPINPSMPNAQPAVGGATKSAPAAPPAKAPQSGYSPAGRSPAYNRTRGFFTAQPSGSGLQAKGGGLGSSHNDPAVAQAGYQQVAPTFIESPTADGQWRAR